MNSDRNDAINILISAIVAVVSLVQRISGGLALRIGRVNYEFMDGAREFQGFLWAVVRESLNTM